jgi:uncharacterized paraquat-inducible protein A
MKIAFLLVWITAAVAYREHQPEKRMIYAVIGLCLTGMYFFVADTGFWLYRARSIMRRKLQHRRRAMGCCIKCGYLLTGNVSGVCPECGSPIEEKRKREEKT